MLKYTQDFILSKLKVHISGRSNKIDTHIELPILFLLDNICSLTHSYLIHRGIQIILKKYQNSFSYIVGLVCTPINSFIYLFDKHFFTCYLSLNLKCIDQIFHISFTRFLDIYTPSEYCWGPFTLLIHSLIRGNMGFPPSKVSK